MSENVDLKTEFGNLRCLNLIGTGNFGRVVLVHHKINNKLYALKVMSVEEIVCLKQEDHVKNEKEILASIKHPFIVNLVSEYQNEKHIYMLLEYIIGGELFSYLRKAGRFDSKVTRVYAAEITVVFEYLHSLNLIYRDLKPENILLDYRGHIKLIDFGFAKHVTDRTWTLCGTPEYLAPETILNKGYNKGVDWWGLGVLIYEMLVGFPPFYDKNPFQIYEKIIDGRVNYPKDFNPLAKDLIRKLLCVDRTKRFGNMKNGANDIKNHEWFKKVNWTYVEEKKTKAANNSEYRSIS